MGSNHIVQFYDAFSYQEGGSVSLMVEYMDGGSLQDTVERVCNNTLDCRNLDSLLNDREDARVRSP